MYFLGCYADHGRLRKAAELYPEEVNLIWQDGVEAKYELPTAFIIKPRIQPSRGVNMNEEQWAALAARPPAKMVMPEVGRLLIIHQRAHYVSRYG